MQYSMKLSIDEALQQGISAHKAGKLEEAERLYRAIIGSVPTHSDANHNLGVLAVGVGKVDTALPYFKTALEASPNHGQYWISYIDALIKLGRIDDASKVLEQGKAAGLSGDAVTKLKNKLKREKHLNPPANSSVIFAPLVRLNPVVTLYENGNLSRALEQGNLLLKEYPKDVKLHNLMGSINHGLRNYKIAAGHFRFVLQQQPLNYNHYSNLGWMYFNLGQLPLAKAWIERSILLHPANAYGLYNLGLTHRRIDHTRDTITDLSVKYYLRALNILPLQTQVLLNLARSYVKASDYLKSLKSVMKGLLLSPHDLNLCDLLATTFFNLDRHQECIIWRKRGHLPGDVGAEEYLQLATCYKQLGFTETAYEHYQKSVLLSPWMGK